jgi:S1-C subfamily serine protease
LLVPRCLSDVQRELYHLVSEPPNWCYELSKWPYQPPRFGISAENLNEKTTVRLKLTSGDGALVTRVVQHLPAAMAGFALDDVVIAVNGKPIKDNQSFSAVLADVKPDQQAEVTILRGGHEMRLIMKPRF